MLGAGFIPMGRVNMTEFAFSGLGINPHHGTPTSPWDRASRRIPGGSSSGSAVAVADGMAAAGLGTDTGGSCRIPAAFCGVVGHKPTFGLVPTKPGFRGWPTLSVDGPLARTVRDAALALSVMAGPAPEDDQSWPLAVGDLLEVATRPVDWSRLRLAVS